MRSSRTFTFGAIAIALLSGALLAQDIPLNNWTVPPYTASASRGGITTMTDSTPPRLFVGIQPCRVADTRGNGAPIQGGIFAAAETRTWDVTNICGIPPGADAISANFTVTGAPVAPPGSFILAWPTGGPVPPVSILNFQAGQTLANAAIVPLGPSEQINVNTSASVHIIMDVNGYFSDTLTNGANYFRLTNNSTQFTAYFDNNSGTCTGACGVYAETSSGHAIFGEALAAVPGSVGVFGHSAFYNGVWGESTNQDGIAGFGGRDGAYLQGARHGAIGVSVATTGVNHGLVGINSSATNDAAGVKGIGVSGQMTVNANCCSDIGVFGESKNGFAVAGASEHAAAIFFRRNATGTILQNTQIATNLGYAFYAATGDYGGTGGKYFVEPHPSDPTKVIKYVSLEGPESGTYFRGRGRFQNGIASIDVPEDFRIVTDEDGLSIQITPIGQMATVAVQSISLNRIVVLGSRNVEFFYTVNGVRRSFKDHRPIVQSGGGEFMPMSASETMPAFPAEIQRRLIRNGTYNEDGRVNMENAVRLGWDRIWAQADHPPSTNPTEP